MTRAMLILLFVQCLQASFASGAYSQVRDPLLEQRKVVALREGPNSVDLLGWDRPGLVVKGFFNNYNAHSLHYYTFYVSYPDSEGGQIRWDVVPFVSESRRDLGISTRQGADCVLRDLRVLTALAPPPTSVIVVVAEREMGDSYADSRPVDFSIYQLRTNATMAPGDPGIYFERVRVLRSREPYCDVEQAFREELGLGSGTQ